jgi:hypothetical protein
MIRSMRSSAFLRFRRARFPLAGVVLALAVEGFAQAARAGDSDKAVARAHYETATRLYEIREYDKALLEYKSAYLAQPDPAFLFNIVAPTAIAQVFDPVAGTFRTTGSMGTARYQPTATLLLNGMVLVAGGSSSGGYLLSAELYK